MARRYRKRKDESPLNILLYVFVLGAFYVWQKTNNKAYGIGFLAISILVATAIVFSIALIRKKKRDTRLLNSGIDVIDTMSGFDFEKLVMVHFENLGYKGEVTKATNDYGADLLLKKDGDNIVVQAKRWRDKVGIKAIQEVVGAINYYKANKGMVITNSYFTPNAKTLAKANNIELWDRNTLIEIMAKNQGKEISEIIKSESKNNTERCPYCNNDLVKRNGKNGAFLGCLSFPKCRFTKNID